MTTRHRLIQQHTYMHTYIDIILVYGRIFNSFSIVTCYSLFTSRSWPSCRDWRRRPDTSRASAPEQRLCSRGPGSSCTCFQPCSIAPETALEIRTESRAIQGTIVKEVKQCKGIPEPGLQRAMHKDHQGRGGRTIWQCPKHSFLTQTGLWNIIEFNSIDWWEKNRGSGKTIWFNWLTG